MEIRMFLLFLHHILLSRQKERKLMKCYIKINSKNKAKQDIDTLMAGMGYRNIAVKGFGGKKVETFLRKVLTLVYSLFVLKKGDVLVMQYPYKKFYAVQCMAAHLRGARTVTLIHDLGTFRRRKLTAPQEMRRLSHTDYIIAHNDRMKQWLVEHAAEHLGNHRSPVSDAGNIGELGIFDYLSDVEPGSAVAVPDSDRIIYAGGLGERKNAFLYEASDAIEGCVMDLYGSGNLDYSRFGHNIRHHGRIASDDFIRDVKGGWGLVWDGDSCDGCGGIWGEYLRLNNPHKCSFYLRAGLPVIVWSESAMAKFILNNKVGIAVERLSDIPQVLKSLGAEECTQIAANVAQMQRRLNEGHYFRKAMGQAVGETWQEPKLM